tara:strand:+ start:4847 stop:5710 length:864 start_codon:yes stop_codon:yes gene_type:complete
VLLKYEKMKIKVITSYKPGNWQIYGKKGIESMAENLPSTIDLVVYAEEAIPDCNYSRITWLDLNTVEPKLNEFKTRHLDNKMAHGQTKDKPGFLWDAVRFSNKVFCVINAVRNSKEYDYVIWLDADTYTFRPVPSNFIEGLCLKNTMLTYLGRENPKLNDGGRYPECGFVCYNLNHPEILNFINTWESLYTKDTIFEIAEWHDSYVFWHLVKKFRATKNIEVNDIGYWKGVKGHHVFVNSELGLYIDHMKGKRKTKGTSARNDLRQITDQSPANVWNIDYWKNAPQS